MGVCQIREKAVRKKIESSGIQRRAKQQKEKSIGYGIHGRGEKNATRERIRGRWGTMTEGLTVQ